MSGRYSRMYSAPVPKMPPGLIQLMEGLAKDVLKNSPVNIYEFCAQHMQRLIKIRDGKDDTHTDVRQNAENQEKEQDSVVGIPKTDEYNITQNKSKIIENNQSLANRFPIADNNLENIIIIKKRDVEEPLKEDKFDSDNQIMIENQDLELCHNNLVTIENKILENENDIQPSHVHEIKCEDTNMGIEDENHSQLLVSVEDIDNVVTDEIKNSTESEVTKEIDGVIEHDEIIPKHTDVNVKLDDSSNIINSDNTEERNHLKEKEFNMDVNLDCPIIDLIKDDNVQEKSKSSDHSISLSSQTTPENEFYSNERYSSLDTGTQSGITNSMDLEKAAITIQKVFRAFLFKSKTLSVDDVTNVDFNFLIENVDKEETREVLVDNFNKCRRSLGLARMDTVLQTVNEEKSLSLSTEDSSTLSSAATIIQAHVRGFLVRSKMPLNQTLSTASVMDSDIPSTSFDGDQNAIINKTVLNIHIVPEGSSFISRDESIITSVDLSLDGSPHYSANLHPLGYDKTERRKQLKREDAVQSVSPPSNNSGKLSEDIESVKELLHNDSHDETKSIQPNKKGQVENDNVTTECYTIETETNAKHLNSKSNDTETTSDEADVVTPFTTNGINDANNQNNTKLLHSGEFHDIVLPTMISRNNSSVVREFHNVLVYFLLWNTS